MMDVPEVCPQCGRLTSWSPLRVWCPSCTFEMPALSRERVHDLVRRWNRAVRDGEGYVELCRENAARREARLMRSTGYSARGKEFEL